MIADRVCDSTPDSVLCRHLSLCSAEVAPGLPGVTRPHRRNCDANEHGGANASQLPPVSPPHTPCSPSASAVTWPPTSLPAPVRSYRTLSALTCARSRHRRVCSLLSSCVTRGFRHTCPRLRFRGVAFRCVQRARSREVPLTGRLNLPSASDGLSQTQTFCR
jgi:hypothetical protein